MSVNVAGASYVKVVINATGGMLGRIVVEAGGLEVSSFYVGGGNGATTYLDNVYFGAYDLYGTTNIRVISVLEPSFGGANANAFLTFVGFLTDGTAAPASAPRARRIELVGDSISAGYGSRGSAALAKNFGCPVNDNTSGNYWCVRGRGTRRRERARGRGRGCALARSESSRSRTPFSSPPALAPAFPSFTTVGRTTGPLPSTSWPTSSPSRGRVRACTSTAATTERRCPRTTCRRAAGRRSRTTGTFRGTRPT